MRLPIYLALAIAPLALFPAWPMEQSDAKPRKVKVPVVPIDDVRKKLLRIPGGFGPRKVTMARDFETEVQGWGLGEKGIAIEKAWIATKGKNVRVAIFDTGIDAKHTELAGRVVLEKNFTPSPNGANDVHGHGTHCAGIVGMAANGKGFVGVAPECELINAKVLDDHGGGELGWLPEAIRWAVEEGKANVISMSIGAIDSTSVDHFYPELRAMIRKVIAQGVIVIVAAGNEGPSERSVCYPGRYPEVICVSASDINVNIAGFSSRGPEVTVAAPGDNIWSCIPGQRYAEWDGTSMACPHVAGVAALYVSACQDAGTPPNQAEFREIIVKSSRTRHPKPPNTASGWGLIQAEAFVARKRKINLPQPDHRSWSFQRDDFTESGWRKVQSLFPGLRSIHGEYDSPIPKK